MNTNYYSKDTHSFANPEEAYVNHLSLNIHINFEEKCIEGIASYNISKISDASQIILDTKDLNIIKVTLNDGEATNFKLLNTVKYLGEALHIEIKSDTTKIHIQYKTNPSSEALQWLTPQQTAGKVHPFLFTQGQAILTRSWIPCQDSPGIRLTYNADVSVRKDLMVVMSASNPTEKSVDGNYQFTMKQAIPPYLIAIAAGDLAYGEIGPRTAVYAEPSMLDASVYEFGDMENMLISAEELYGSYDWDRYDVIVLPPSFPFGGMENPRLTFATPTIIAGDKSLTSLIAHELAHSWSGNLVTNATWNDFWLNEGFTVYFERRIMEKLYGIPYANMLAQLGFQDLEDTINRLDKKDTHLYLDLEGRDPDDGMNDIAYEKGSNFLLMIEQKIGREKMDQFLNDYFSAHKFQSITTNQFIDYIKVHLIQKENIQLNYEEWIYGPGLPENKVVITSNKFDLVQSIVNNYINNNKIEPNSTKEWTTHEFLHFIRQLPNNKKLNFYSKLDQIFQFSFSKNREIQAAWYELSINSGYFEENIEQIKLFLNTVGRRKFLIPLYTALKKTGHIDKALNIYNLARDNYHYVSIQTIDDLLDWK